MTGRSCVLALVAIVATACGVTGSGADAGGFRDGKADWPGGDGDVDAAADLGEAEDSDLAADGPTDRDVPGDVQADVDRDAAAVPLEGFGAISGDCGVLDDEEWGAASPFFFRSTLDLGDAAFDPALLSAGAQEILAEGTAGGSSGNSEALAFDLLHRCELAELVLSETEVAYTDPDSKRTDILVLLDGRHVAVSVARAYNYPPTEPCQVERLRTLLARKLGDAEDAESHADPANDWDRSILSVIAYSDQCAEAVADAYAAIDDETRSDIILMVTVTDGADEFLY